jgi:hypothetical protein
MSVKDDTADHNYGLATYRQVVAGCGQLFLRATIQELSNFTLPTALLAINASECYDITNFLEGDPADRSPKMLSSRFMMGFPPYLKVSLAAKIDGVPRRSVAPAICCHCGMSLNLLASFA